MIPSAQVRCKVVEEVRKLGMTFWTGEEKGAGGTISANGKSAHARMHARTHNGDLVTARGNGGGVDDSDDGEDLPVELTVRRRMTTLVWSAKGCGEYVPR